MTFDESWPELERELRQLAETRTGSNDGAHLTLTALGLASGAELTSPGEAYYMARFVAPNDLAAREALGQALKSHALVNAFCEATWPYGEIPVTGANSLLRRLGMGRDDVQTKRWLELMGRASLVSYNRNRPLVGIRYNPRELLTEGEDSNRERNRGHLLSPDTPYSNILALRKVLRAARGFLYWYEPHMGDKVLEVLHAELQINRVTDIRLLSGPAQVRLSTKADFRRFESEFLTQRKISAAWRVLPKDQTSKVHGRFILSEGIARNLPPLNLIIRGVTDEILPSEFSVEQFAGLWGLGVDLKNFTPTPEQ